MWATNVQRTVTQICVHLSADASKVQASLALVGKFGIAASFADIHIHCRDISHRASASPRMSSFSHRIQSDIQFMISCISRFTPLPPSIPQANRHGSIKYVCEDRWNIGNHYKPATPPKPRCTTTHLWRLRPPGCWPGPHTA